MCVNIDESAEVVCGLSSSKRMGEQFYLNWQYASNDQYW